MDPLQRLPDLVHSCIAECLPSWCLDSLASTSRWARACPGFVPRTRVLARTQGMADHLTQPHSQAALGRLLAIRGGGACKKLLLGHAWAIGACVPAFRGGRGSHLTTLVLGKWKEQEQEEEEDDQDQMVYGAVTDEVDAAAVGSMLQLLPGLRRLVLRLEAVGQGGWAAVWAALAAGACPELEHLDVSAADDAAWSSSPDEVGSLDLAGLVRALHARSARGLVPLQQLALSVRLGVEAEGMEMLTSEPALPVEKLHLLCLATREQAAMMGAFLRGPTARRLVVLAIYGVVTEDAAGLPSLMPADDVIQALAESGVGGGLEQLYLFMLQASGAGVAAVQSLLASRQRRVDLKATYIFLHCLAPLVLEGYSHLMYTLLTGCPSLRMVMLLDWPLGHDVDTALRLLLPPQPALPSLNHLTLLNVPEHDGGFLSLQPSLPALTSLTLTHVFAGTIRPLSLSLPHMPALRKLDLGEPGGTDAARCSELFEPLALALSGGAARELRVLEMACTGEQAAPVLQAVVDGACPKLRELKMKSASREGEPSGAAPRVPSADSFLPLRSCVALASILAGASACSASLEVLDVQGAFWIDPDGLELLRMAFVSAKCARLRQLSLSCISSTTPRSTGDLVEALRRPRAASCLEQLSLLHVQLEENDDKVVQLLRDGLLSGVWPSMMGHEPLQLWEVKDDGTIPAVLGEEVYGREYRQRRGVRMFGPEGVREVVTVEEQEGGEVGVGKGQEEEKVVVRCHGWWRWWLRWLGCRK